MVLNWAFASLILSIVSLIFLQPAYGLYILFFTSLERLHYSYKVYEMKYFSVSKPLFESETWKLPTTLLGTKQASEIYLAIFITTSSDYILICCFL